MTFKTFLVAAACWACTTLGATAQMTPLAEMPAGSYNLDLSHSSLIWRVNHKGLSMYTARFTKFDAALDLEPTDPAASTLSVSVVPMSLQTDFPFDYKDWNDELRTGEQLFNSGSFPAITYVADTVEITGDNTGTISGTLELLGVKAPVTLDVTFNGAYAEEFFTKKPTIGFSATGTVTRSEFGMGAFIPSIGDEIELVIQAEFAMEK